MRREVRRNRVGSLFHRWYEAGTGRYGRVDPLGLLRGDDHPYVYAASNPIVTVDLLGLTSYRGFPADKEQLAKEAVSKVKQQLQDTPCCVGNSPKLLRRLENATLVYTEDLRFKGDPICGFVGPANWIRRRMQIGGPAFKSRCGPLECTVLHELLHLGVRNAGEGAAYKAEKDCFNCGTGKPPDE